MARIRSAGIVQMAEQSRFTWRALAEEAADAVMTRGAVETSGTGAIVDVLRAIRSGPSVNANAGIAAVRVGARGAVLAYAGSKGTFIDVLVAVRPRE